MTTSHIINNEADLLDAAAAELEENGWCRGRYTNDVEELCIIGAMRKATLGRVYEEHFIANSQLNYITNAVNAIARRLHMPVAHYNDDVCHDEHEAINTLRQTAKEWREEHQL